MSTINGKHYSIVQLFQIYFKQRSRNYQREHNIRKADWCDMGYRVISALGDLVVLLSPMYLWVLLLLLVMGDLLPIRILNYAHWVILGLMVATFGFLAPCLSAMTYGQSLGKYLCRFKVVKKNGNEASKTVLFMREALRNLPVLILQVLFGFIPVLIYLGINTVFLLIDPKHRSIVDLLFQTRVVVLLSQSKKVAVKQPVNVVEETPRQISTHSIDLQMYSDFSFDGVYSVEELFQMAKKQGMRYISITDQNSAKANTIAEKMSTLYGVGYVPGIEISCMYKGKEVQLLAYHIDYRKEAFQKIENDYLTQEKELSLTRAIRFETYTGIKIDVTQLLENNRFQVITPKMIAKQVFRNKENHEHPMISAYISGAYRHDPYRLFERNFFGVNGPCYMERKLPDMRVIAEVVKRAGGRSILAAPMYYFDNDVALIEKAMQYVDGIQVFTPLHDKTQMTSLMKLANAQKCLIGAGSGFNGDSFASMGESHYPNKAEKILMKVIQE